MAIDLGAHHQLAQPAFVGAERQDAVEAELIAPAMVAGEFNAVGRRHWGGAARADRPVDQFERVFAGGAEGATRRLGKGCGFDQVAGAGDAPRRQDQVEARLTSGGEPAASGGKRGHVAAVRRAVALRLLGRLQDVLVGVCLFCLDVS